MKRAVVVICDGLRADMVTPNLTPNRCALAQEGQSFTRHCGVFPSTTRTTSASIARDNAIRVFNLPAGGNSRNEKDR